MYDSVFKRYELKYIITEEKAIKLKALFAGRMKPDKYGKTSIRNIYYDTDSFELIRKSIERPVYKEKLRVRSYGTATADSTVFVELKKKYDSVVFKRRTAIACKKAEELLKTGGMGESQIEREIDYFLSFYRNLKPKAFISYDREAYYAIDDETFRVTFDRNITFRDYDLSLTKEPYGDRLLKDGTVLVEIKCAGGFPLWITEFLSKEKIRKTSFSKYGTAYTDYIFKKLRENYYGNVI